MGRCPRLSAPIRFGRWNRYHPSCLPNWLTDSALAVQFSRHFVGNQLGLLFHHFLTKMPAGMADGQQPKKRREDGADDGYQEQQAGAIQDRIQSEGTPLLASHEIDWRHENYAKVHRCGAPLKMFRTVVLRASSSDRKLKARHALDVED